MKFKLTDTKYYNTGIKLLLVYIIIVIADSVYQSQQVIKTGKWIRSSGIRLTSHVSRLTIKLLAASPAPLAQILALAAEAFMNNGARQLS